MDREIPVSLRYSPLGRLPSEIRIMIFKECIKPTPLLFELTWVATGRGGILPEWAPCPYELLTPFPKLRKLCRAICQEVGTIMPVESPKESVILRIKDLPFAPPSAMPPFSQISDKHLPFEDFYSLTNDLRLELTMDDYAPYIIEGLLRQFQDHGHLKALSISLHKSETMSLVTVLQRDIFNHLCNEWPKLGAPDQLHVQLIGNKSNTVLEGIHSLSRPGPEEASQPTRRPGHDGSRHGYRSDV
ncbi:hypothetical protein CAC42_7437 [Sphaceloma murrayae]|uniref:Uncharacterized protein n=1 Tax=Sphaceloma murrayae TaxID=2082308 RepID=A0A2K1QXF9_9PEZI|nr:hypothetical protein CAC42_7437 [Sphaceloma murrayae]